MGINITKNLISAEFEDLKKDLNQGTIPKVAAEYKERLNEMQNLPINIAITGQSGSGKSSFVNAIRGIKDDDDKAAKTGPTEETMEPTPYPHPSFPNIQMWDLPGIGTPKFQAKNYLKTVKFETYDAFIIVTSNRFTENDALLAKEIQKMGKKFYFVCTKIDASIEGEKRKENFNEEKTLETIRNYCKDNLKSLCEPSTRIFLVSSWQVQKYDFPCLQETIAADLPEHKKHILILAVNMFSEDKLMMKKELMKSYIRKVALVSCAFGAVPVPGLSIACDVGILIDALKQFCKVFGLDDRSLRFLAHQTGKDLKELRSAVKKTPLLNSINGELVASLLMKSTSWVAVTAVEMVLDFIPVIGSVFGGASSYIVTYYFLNSFLNDAVEDAQNVQATLLK